MPRLTRSCLLPAALLALAVSSLAAARPPLFLLDTARLEALRAAVAVPGTTHHDAFQALRSRVDANDIPGNNTGDRTDFAREAALAYLITGQTSYAQAAYQRLEEVYTVSMPAGQGGPIAGQGLDRAQGIANFSMAYNWAYDAWTPEQRAWILDKLNEALDQYPSQALSHPNIGFGANNSNWTGVVAGAHVITLIALDLQDERRFEFQTSRELLRTHLLSFGSRGWTQEGNYYFVLSMEYYLPAMLALREINDPSLEGSFTARRPHHVTQFAGMFNAGQHSLTWGVGGDTFPAYGMTSSLLGLVPPGELGYYRWFYDRYRGQLNPAAAANKYDHLKSGTIFALLSYPTEVTAADPTGHYPTVIHDNLGGYLFRSGWQDQNDTIVGLWADTTNHGRAWNQRDAGQINILSHGSKWGYGPGPATSGLDAAFSQILVNGIARTDSGQGSALGHEVAPNGGYARISGGSKFANLGVTEAIRHVLADFSGDDFAIVSTFDRLRANESHTYGWNLYLPGKTVTVGSDSVHDLDTFVATDSNGSYLKAWFMVHGNGFITENFAARYEYDAQNADLWVIMVAGRGTPPEISVTGTGLNAVVTLGGTVLSFDAAAQRIRSSTLTGLNTTTDPILTASPTSGPAPLTVNFSGSGTADPGETLSYRWNFGDGTTSTAQAAAHTFTEEGLYVVTLEVADGQGGTDQVLRHIIVGNREPTARIAASATTVLPGVAVSLSGAGSTDPEGGPLSYAWTFGDGRTETTADVEVSWSVEGSYPVELRVTDAAGLVHVARVTILVKNLNPIAAFTASTLGGVVPFPVTFDASGSYDPEGEALLYRWNFGDGTLRDTTEPVITHTFTQVKNHTVRLTALDPEGKSGTTTRVITALGEGNLLPAVADPGEVAQGLNYQVYRGDPSSGNNLPDISTLRPLNAGRAVHFDHDVTDLNQFYVLVFEGFLLAPADGLYSFRLRPQQQGRVRVGGVTVVQSNNPHSGTYEGFISLAAGYHRYRVEINYAPEFPGSTFPATSILWTPPGEEVYQPIPAAQLFAPVALFQPQFRATPSTVYDGGTVAFEATVASPNGAPLSYLWNFGDGQTSTEPRVSHTYQLSSSDDHRVYNATLTVTDSTGTALTVGEQITVSRFAGLVMSPQSSIRRNRWAFDQRSAPRDTTRAINHALEPGAILSYSSEFRPDLGGSMTVDNDYRTRWVSSQPQDWVRFSFTGTDGSPKAYRLTEYSFTSGALGWTSHRDPRDWEVYGSNVADPAPFSMALGAANPEWVLIDQVTGQKGLTRIMPIIYSLPNPNAYAHYLFHLRNQSGGIETEIELTEIQIFSYPEDQPPLAGNEPPVVALTVSTTEVDGPLPIHFDAAATRDPDGDWLYYTWNFGDGQVHQRQLGQDFVTHTYYQPGEYEVSLTVTDARGLSSTVNRTITVLPSPPNQSPAAHYTASADTVLVGNSLTLDGRSTVDPEGEALHFRWEFGDGVFAEGEVVSHTYFAPGVYQPVLVVTDARGRKGTFFRPIEILAPNGGRGVLSFNFNRDAGRLNPYRGAGLVSVGFWNDLNSSRAPAWYDSAGQPVGVSLTSTGRQSSFGSIYPVDRFDGNAQLGARSDGMTPYGSNEGFTWTVANIPYAVYDVYVYFGGSFNADARAVYVNGEPRYVVKQGHGFPGQWVPTEAATTATVVPGGNVMLWRNLTSSSLLLEKLSRASDGIAGFQIVDKTGSPDAPPVVAITSPAPDSFITEGDSLQLTGSAMMGETPLADPFLRWESSLDGFLGNGASLSVSGLSVGSHTLTLTGTNAGNLSMSASVVFDVFPLPAAPRFLTQPASVTTYETATVAFSVSVAGSPPIFTYQWRRNGDPITDGPGFSGATTATLTLTDVAFASAGTFDVVVANSEGLTPSNPAELVITELVGPSFTQVPAGGTFDLGGTLTLSATVSGSQPMTFAWSFQGQPLANGGRISGADTATLTITGLTATDQGQYALVATNAGGSVPSGPIAVTVNLPPVIAVLRPTGAIGEIPFGTGAWLRTAVTDDAFAEGQLGLAWTLVEGPGSVTFTDRYAAETGVTFPVLGEYTVRLTASDGSLTATHDVTLIVRDDLEGLDAPVGPPLVSDIFDWGTANRSNTQFPAGSGWRLGTNNFSYVGGRSALWPSAGQNPYVLFGHPSEGGLLRGNVQHHPRGVQRDFPAAATGQRWVSVLVWLQSGFDNVGQTAVFSLGNDPSYSLSGIKGQGFGFHHNGTDLRLAALDGVTPVASAATTQEQQQWVLVIARTVVNPDGADSISLWSFPANATFGLTESSLGPAHVAYEGFNWGAGYSNLWVGASRPNGPTATFELDELRVSTEGGDRGLGQVLAASQDGIQIGPEVAIAPAGPITPGEATALVATVSDPDNHPDPVALQWSSPSGPGAVVFATPTSATTDAIFPVAGSYVLRVIADDGAVATFAERLFAVGDALDRFTAWMDDLATGLPAHRRGPLDDASGDGLPNLLAYALGRDPRDRQRGPDREVIQVAADADGLIITLRIPAGLDRPDLHYRVLHSTDLGAWTAVAEALQSTTFSTLGSSTTILSRDADRLQLRTTLTAGFFVLDVSLVE